jgi:hypothetical protein
VRQSCWFERGVRQRPRPSGVLSSNRASSGEVPATSLSIGDDEAERALQKIWMAETKKEALLTLISDISGA